MAYEVKYWEDEECREQGISETYYEVFTDIDRAIEKCKKLGVHFASAEVLDMNGEAVFYCGEYKGKHVEMYVEDMD